jgi:hypothetical protein
MEKFEDWFYEIEGFHVRAERFWVECENRDFLLEWMKASYEAGRMSNGTTEKN